ncbi:MAG: hypothetical protein OXC83_12735 [Chloroflexi bacterium]|nr:hypothetical protein [Chloroflexota bacterium]
MAAIVGIILAATIVIVLVYPFIKGRRNAAPAADQVDRVASADTLRHLLYREPVTLRNEFESGNITEREYEMQLEELRVRAAGLMQQRAERRNHLLAAELELEREVRRIRQARQASESKGDNAEV